MAAYDQQTWANGSGGGTPLNADRLNHMEAGIAAAALDADVDSAVAALTSSIGGKVATARTIQGQDLSADRSFRLDQWSAPIGPVAMGSQQLTGLLAGDADDEAVNLGQMNSALANKLTNSSAALKSLIGGKVPCIVLYDAAGSSWHASTYTSQAADVDVFFFFIFGVDDGTHQPFATAGGSAWILLEET